MKYLIKVPEWRKRIKVVTHHTLFSVAICSVIAIIFEVIAMRVGMNTEKIRLVLVFLNSFGLGGVLSRLINPDWDKPEDIE